MERLYKTDNTTKIYRVLFDSNNVFLICADTKTMIVNTGQTARRRKLFNRLSQIKETQNGIDYLCLTHTHFDHCRNAKAIKDKFNTEVIVSEGEAKSLSKGLL
jgi:glyoxylase-like metal-dependent hydrolase (beta-lactamase superfamily II)